MNLPAATRHPASYRDPSGFIFSYKDVVYRQINQSYKNDFELLISSGLYQQLVNKELLIPHTEVKENLTGESYWYKTIRPEQVPFISYPYEWSFDMLKEAATTTLHIAKTAIKYGMMLKDATPYNLQWVKGQMVFIDTLSFQKYEPEKPWIAYRQFCENFVAPLALMHYLQTSLQTLLLAYPDGIPLSLAKKCLPWKSKWNFHAYLHVHLHAAIASKNDEVQKREVQFSASKMERLLSSLHQLIHSLQLKNKTTWSDYYTEAQTRGDYLPVKKKMINDWLSEINDVKQVLDIAGNDGSLTKTFTDKGIFVVNTDNDHFAVNELYHAVKKEKNKFCLPLVIDMANPSPSNGVNLQERAGFFERAWSDVVLSVAFIHHIAIGKNIPFSVIAAIYQRLGKMLLIEFVPLTDEKVKLMLKQKTIPFDWYTEDNFVEAFLQLFTLVKSEPIAASGRTLYLFKNKEG